jgi:hypothetical protein
MLMYKALARTIATYDRKTGGGPISTQKKNEREVICIN